MQGKCTWQSVINGLSASFLCEHIFCIVVKCATGRFEYYKSAISHFCQSDPSNFEHARMNYIDFFGTKKWIQWNSYIHWCHENEKILSVC